MQTLKPQIQNLQSPSAERPVTSITCYGLKLGGTFGSGLFDFMRERGIPSITVPITYRDSNNNWFQTDVTLEREVQKSGGLRLGWTQKRIPAPSDTDS